MSSYVLTLNRKAIPLPIVGLTYCSLDELLVTLSKLGCTGSLILLELGLEVKGGLGSHWRDQTVEHR